MQFNLQNIVLPQDEKHQVHWKLFYRGPRCTYDTSNQMFHLPKGIVIDFATYLNGFSNEKWKKYTDLSNLTLHLSISGEFILKLVGYSLNPLTPDRKEFTSYHYTCASGFEDISVIYPDSEEALLSFEIHPISDCILQSGFFSAEYDINTTQAVNLAIATTTCKKEDFIVHNVNLIKENLLSSDDEIGQHLFVHVVDNGQTLTEEQIYGDHVYLHPNKNVGGSGGFARGMIEALEQQDPQITHVLLMDDDVLVLPESIRRTYILLRLLKRLYREHFINGAMLEYGAMNMQHEDLGLITNSADFCPVKGTLNQNDLTCVLKTNIDYPDSPNMYGAWWYCCIPITQIKKNGLPLPFFIRVDDSEYGIRCNPGFITMTGICVWHLGFVNKYNVSMDLYQTFRNLLIAQSTTGILPNADVLGRFKRSFRAQLLEFAYNGAEICLEALEDYMKGPEFIEQDLGEKILVKHRAYNEKMVPLTEFSELNVVLNQVYNEAPRKQFERFIYRLTYNGHRFLPKCFLKKDIAVIGFDWSYQPQTQSLHKQLLAVNVHDATASMRTMDRKKYKELMKRYKKDMRYYQQNCDSLREAYSARKDYLVSMEFWKKYLEI